MTNEKLYEVLGDIHEKHVKEARECHKTKKPVWLKWGAMAACLCLLILGTFVVQRIGTPGTIIEHPKESKLVVNEVDHTTNLDMDVQISYYHELSSTEWETVMDAFERSIGFSYEEFMKKLPAAYHNTAFYSIDTPIVPKSTEYIPHDYVFEFLTENGGNVEIAICTTEEPLRDCFFVCDDPKESEINGTTAVIYGVRDSFMVQFACAGVNYDIETHSIPLEELENLLTCMINQ